MPGTIRVSVLEAIDLPELLTDETTVRSVTAKVTLGSRLFKTQPGVADGGKIETWNSDFAFPVMNLRDKLVVSICDSEDHSVTQTAIEISSIIQKGSLDEFVSLNKGGRIHLRMSFVLTDEERKKIERMRVASLKRREEVQLLKKTLVIQPLQGPHEKELMNFSLPTAAIADVDGAVTFQESKELPNRSVGLVSTPKLPARKPIPDEAPKLFPTQPLKSVPNPMFNYAKAIGVQSSLECIEKRSNLFLPGIFSDKVADGIGAVNSGVQTRIDAREIDTSGPNQLDSSLLMSPCSIIGTCPLAKISVDSMPQINFTAPGGAESFTNGVETNNAQSGGKLVLPENAQLHISFVSPSSSDMPVSLLRKPTSSTPLVKILSNEGNANSRPSNLEAMEVGESAENAGSSAGYLLNITLVDVSPVRGDETAPLATPADNTSNAPGGPLGVSSPGSITLNTVMARVNRTFSKVSSCRSSRRASSNILAAHTRPAVPVVWLQDWVRKALSNVKGCYRATA